MEARTMGERIIGPSHEATGYYSKLKKPLSNPRQPKCPYDIQDCKVCFPKFQAKIEEREEDPYKLNPPDWVHLDLNIFLILAHFYPEAEMISRERNKAIRDFELIDVYWRRNMPAAESPVFEMSRESIRTRLSRIRKEAKDHITDSFQGIVVAPPPCLRFFPDGDPDTFDYHGYLRNFPLFAHFHSNPSK
jgi:hypothetical protein